MRVRFPEWDGALALHRSEYCPSADWRSSAGSIASIETDTVSPGATGGRYWLPCEAVPLHFPLNSCRWGSCCPPQWQKSSPVGDPEEACGSWKFVLAQKRGPTRWSRFLLSCWLELSHMTSKQWSSLLFADTVRQPFASNVSIQACLK